MELRQVEEPEGLANPLGESLTPADGRADVEVENELDGLLSGNAAYGCLLFFCETRLAGAGGGREQVALRKDASAVGCTG